jgi:hypothetical protein
MMISLFLVTNVTFKSDFYHKYPCVTYVSLRRNLRSFYNIFKRLKKQ